MFRKISSIVILSFSGICIAGGLFKFMLQLAAGNATYEFGVIVFLIILGLILIYVGSYIWGIKRIQKLSGIVLTSIGGYLFLTILVYFNLPDNAVYDNRILAIFLQLFSALAFVICGIVLINLQHKSDIKQSESAD